MTNLQPGPEMDAAVARALGWRHDPDNVLLHPKIKAPCWWRPDLTSCFESDLPDWSTDDACAVRDVLPEIERLGLGVVISTHGRPHCIISDGKTGGFETQWIFADKLAHAICAAFLEAVEKTT